MRLRTLGALRLEGSSLTRPKPLLKLAYLALNGPTSRRELSDVFFRDADDARDSLSTSLRHLRRAEVVELLPDDRIACRVACDATELLADFDAYRYETVLAAYAGPFLDGLDVGLGLDLETWLFTTREAIARRVRSAALHRARAALAEGRLEAARQSVLLAVTLRDAPEFELDELAHALPLLDRLGLPEAGPLRELAEGYGLDLERPRLVREGSSSAAATETPVRTTAFFGREDELRTLDELLRDPEHRLVTLFGLGGVGKTRLAGRLLERLAAREPERFPDGVAIVALEAVPRPEAVVPAIAARLALPAVAGASAAGLADALAGWQALLVLDNFEHLTAAVDDVVHLLRACPRLRLLVTSRIRLGVSAERTVELAGLSTRHGAARPSDAASLFLERAERVGYPPEAAARDRGAVEALCAELEGYPLGIELAATMTRALSVAEIRAALGDAVGDPLDVLDHGPVDAPARHRAVRTALEPSWALLDDREREALLRLGAFRAGFQFDAAAAVAGVSLPLLLRLVDHAWVRSDGSGRGRFALHPVVRAFLRERSDGSVTAASTTAHWRFFARMLASSAERVAAEPREVLDRLAVDLPDVLHAIQVALDTDHDEVAVAMARALVVDADYLQARGGGREAIAVARAAASRAESRGDLASAERLWTKVANATRTMLGDVPGATRHYERALTLAGRAGDTGRQVMLHAILGVMLEASAPEEGTAHLARARTMADASGDPLLRCEVLQREAHVANVRGGFASARDLNAELVRSVERLRGSSQVDAARVTSLLYFGLGNLGVALDELGDVAASIAPRRRALELALEREQALWIAYARENLAVGLAALGEAEEARTHALEAVGTFERHGEALARARTRAFLAGLPGPVPVEASR